MTGGSHNSAMTIRRATAHDLAALASLFSEAVPQIAAAGNCTCSCRVRWPVYADVGGVQPGQRDRIQEALRLGIR